MEFLLDKTIEHLADYSTATKLCVRKLAQTYSDLGLGKDEQLAALDKVKAQAMSVWSDACENADTERQALRDRVRGLPRSWQLESFTRARGLSMSMCSMRLICKGGIHVVLALHGSFP